MDDHERRATTGDSGLSATRSNGRAALAADSDVRGIADDRIWCRIRDHADRRQNPGRWIDGSRIVLRGDGAADPGAMNDAAWQGHRSRHRNREASKLHRPAA